MTNECRSIGCKTLRGMYDDYCEECLLSGSLTLQPNDFFKDVFPVDSRLPTPMAYGLGVGDINSSAKGSGARFNTGKSPYDLIPLRQLGISLANQASTSPEGAAAAKALMLLGEYQARRRGVEALYGAMEVLGIEGWEECARVFDYGRKKYAAWNWAKGMAWSIPIACAARHLIDITRGQLTDIDKPGAPGSQEAHRGHVFCNLVMLLTYAETFLEGDDRPTAGLLALTP